MKLTTVPFSPFFCFSLLHRSAQSIQYPVLEHHEFMREHKKGVPWGISYKITAFSELTCAEYVFNALEFFLGLCSPA
jgi:hypothetical protein